MRLRLRMLIIIIASFFRDRLRLTDENVLSLMVLPNDVDILRVSSDRYLPLMELGRMNIVFRAGLFKRLVKQKWVPLARIVTIRYRYPLKIFQRFQLHTRAVHWDEEWVWVEQQFVRKGRTTALALAKVAFIGPEGLVPVSEIIAAVGESISSPPMPKIITDLHSIEEQIKDRQK